MDKEVNHSKQENQDHSGKNSLNPDDHEAFGDFQFDNVTDDSLPDYHMPIFFKVVYLLDICLSLYFFYYTVNLDLSMVPKRFYGEFNFSKSWVNHLVVPIYLQPISVFFAFLLLSSPLLERTSLFYSVFQRFHERDIDTRFIPLQIFIKILIASSYFAPMFGMTTFEMSGKIFFFAFLWHGFMAISMFIWLMNLTGIIIRRS